MHIMHDMDGYIRRIMEKKVLESTEDYPVVALLGGRQVGKSTLAKALKIKDIIYLDLELPSDLAKLNDPEIFFDLNSQGFVCLDEIQRTPEIFKILKGVVDKRNKNKQFLVLGSASIDLLRQSSESLAGRICYLEIAPFDLLEIDAVNFIKLWIRGGYPRSFLSKTDEKSFEWRNNYIRTYLEQDIPRIGLNISNSNIERLWKMLAHCQGTNLNSSKIAGSLGINTRKLNFCIDILEKTFIIRFLRPFESSLKRYVKSPKIYIRDSGILHTLLNIKTINDLMGHPIYGASFEGLVIENIINRFSYWEYFYYRTKSGAEIDLVMVKGKRIVAIEIKASKSPSPSRGFWTAVEDIKAEEKYIISLVDDTYQIKNNVIITNLPNFLESFLSTD